MKSRIITSIACVSACCDTAALASDTPGGAALEIVSRHKAVFTAPARKTPSDGSVDGPLLGNGDTLVALGGNAAKLQFHIGKNELWKMSKDKNTTAQPLARLDVAFPEMADATYRVEQDLATGITTGRFTKDGRELTLETGVSATENLLWAKLSVTGGSLEGTARLFEAGGTAATLSDPGGPVHVGREMHGRGRGFFDGEIAGLRVVPEALSGTVDGKPENPGNFDGAALRVFVNGALKAGPPEASAPAAPGDIQVVQRHFKAGDPLPFRGQVSRISIPAGAACALCVLGSDSSAFTVTPEQPVVIIAAVTGFYGDGADFAAQAVQRASAFRASDLPEITADHIAWWRAFWSRSFVEIPDAQLEQSYYLSHYGMASCSRVPDFPPGIFGWVTTDNPMWFGDYHMNYNFVSPFYALYAANHLEQAAPCNEPILANYETARKWSLERTGVEGTFQTVGIGPLGSVAYLVDHGQKSNSSYSCVPLAKYWFATYDTDFGKRAYPFVRDTALFWENWLKFEEGRYVLYGCSAHEGSGTDMNGIVALGLIRMVMNLALDMSAELGVDADRHAKWKHIRAHLSEYPTMNHEKTGKPIFRYTERGIAWFPSNTIGIQHIYPAGGIGLDSPPELIERSRNMIDALGRWIDGNGMNSFYAAAARVGYNPGTILEKMKDMLTRVGGPNGMVLNNPHGVELFSIVPNAIQEMLMQSHEGVVRLFPCWPEGMDARFGTLRTRGAFLVSAERKNGVVSGVRIHSEKGRDLTLQNPWPGRRVGIAGHPESFEGARFTIKTHAGEVLEIHPAEDANGQNALPPRS